ncbi:MULTISPECIES: glycerate kinase [unclassified Leeuwenhoekiella]|uniref:glycerate kinase n=1 Tax=unclassified Leeuwenhoekiella TaxID=2615029 RepID=UPI0025BC3F3C|nr:MULTISPECIES: glycerate kinase [unclassified Leeuwenhoekiella]
MKILVAPDSFKESLTASEVACAIALGIEKCLPYAQCVSLPFSDGGEGAFEVLGALNLGKCISVATQDPLGRALTAPYFEFTDSKTVWIELSQASGLALLKIEDQNPLNTSTYGTGMQIRHALERGKDHIILGIGGSATHDVATGIFSALGGKLLDQNGNTLKASGAALEHCTALNWEDLMPQLQNSHFTIACDVHNKLTGTKGAAAIYAAQKGATPEIIDRLEQATIRFGKILEKETGQKILDCDGGGAAGGTAAGLLAFAQAELKNGFDILSELTALEDQIKQVDLIITGEGRTDDQSKFGKVPFKIAALAQKHKKSVLLYSGGVTASPRVLKEGGFTEAFAIKTEAMSLDYAKENASKLLTDKVVHTLKDFI